MELDIDEWKQKNMQNAGPNKTIKRRMLGLLRKLGWPLLFSVVYPLVFYYGTRAMGVSAFSALIAGALPLVGFQLYQFISNRKFDLLGIFILIVLGISVALAFVTGNPRFMLAKAGFFTAIIGLGFLVSVSFGKPVAYTISTYLLERMEVSKDHLEGLWTDEPKFRRVWRISTIIWGIGTLVNAAIIMWMAYQLPMDWVPILNTVIHFLIFVLLQIITNLYYKKQGIWKLVFEHGR